MCRVLYSVPPSFHINYKLWLLASIFLPWRTLSLPLNKERKVEMPCPGNLLSPCSARLDGTNKTWGHVTLTCKHYCISCRCRRWLVRRDSPVTCKQFLISYQSPVTCKQCLVSYQRPATCKQYVFVLFVYANKRSVTNTQADTQTHHNTRPELSRAPARRWWLLDVPDVDNNTKDDFYCHLPFSRH